MVSYFYPTAVIYVFFSSCLCCAFTKNNHKSAHSSRNLDPKKSKVLLTNDGPTTIGGKTIFSAVVLNCNGEIYRYCWRFKHWDCYNKLEPKDSLVIGNWSSIGQKKIILEVTGERNKFCGTNTTTVLVTGTISAVLNVSAQTDQDGHLFVGPVDIFVQIHDPSHLFDPKKIFYTWDFNDSTVAKKTHLNRMTHNFTEDRVYYVSVFITAYASKTLYKGTASEALPFVVNFAPNLQVYNLNDHKVTPMLKLALPMQDRTFVALGEVKFIITYKNPYSIIKNVTTGWSFQDGPTFPHLPGSSTSHNYTFLGETSVWATVRFTTQNQKYSRRLPQEITVEEPVSELKLTANSSRMEKGDLQVNITCCGSKPFQMCWKVFETSDQPLFDNCSSLSQTCDFKINYTIHYSGSFTLDIFVLNRVGSANHIQKFSIPEPAPNPPSDTAAKTAGAVVPVVICTIIVVVVLLVFVAKKVYSNRHHSVLETADFDFRDEDNRSLDSYLVDNKCCYSFRFCRRFSRKKDTFPLLENWEGSRSKVALYSDVL